MLTDYRANPSAEGWSYYVVDNLPTMSNIYRYDTVPEAISKYKEIPESQRSAIGASKDNRYELDLIHRCKDNEPVLVMDFQRSSHDCWRSKEIQTAIDYLIADLSVHYQMDCDIFPKTYPSVYIELERYTGNDFDRYFADKHLCPSEIASPIGDTNFLTSINEVFVPGEGWLNTPDFLKLLDNSRPGGIGIPRKDIFVERLNIKYEGKYRHEGQADISPREYKLLREKTILELEKQRKPELNSIISNAETRAQKSGQATGKTRDSEIDH